MINVGTYTILKEYYQFFLKFISSSFFLNFVSKFPSFEVTRHIY